jgi:glutathione S-transferase
MPDSNVQDTGIDPMIQLYYAPDTAAYAVHAALEEAGADYTLVRVDLGPPPAGRDPAYLALHPHGQVPTLVDGDTVVFESAAIMMYLADRFPGAALAPPPGSRALFYQWLVYMADTVQTAYKMHYYPHRYSVDAEDVDAVRARAEERLMESWSVLDRALARGPWLLGDAFSGCDLHLQMLTRWYRDPVALLARFPNVARCANRVRERRSVRAIQSAHVR